MRNRDISILGPKHNRDMSIEHVTRFLLLATYVPIIKDKLECIISSKEYRSIAISSLILKLIDWIIILIFGDKLGLHDLQFAYQPGISGNMCTYAVLKTVDYFLRHYFLIEESFNNYKMNVFAKKMN